MGIIIGTGASLFWNLKTPESNGIPTSDDVANNNQQITLEVFSDPVFVTGSDSYEREAISGERLGEGDLISTGHSGRAQLVFPSGTVTRLDTNTHIEIVEADVTNRQIRIVILDGHIWSRVAEMKDGQYYQTESEQIRTHVKGTSYGHYRLSPDKDKIVTTKGEVISECVLSNKKTPVGRDLKLIANCADNENSLAVEQISKEDTGDNWFQFNQEEDSYLNNRFGPYVYNDENDSSVLGVQDRIRDVVSNTRNRLGTLLNRDTVTPTAEPTPTTEPLAVVSSSNTSSTQPTPTGSAKDSPSITPSNGNNNQISPTRTVSPTVGVTPTVQPSPVPTTVPSSEPIAKLNILNPVGKVYITNPFNGNRKLAKAGDVLYIGSRVETEGVQTEIEFENGSVTRLDVSSSITLAGDQSKKFDIRVLLDAGRIWSRIKKLTGNEESYGTQTESMVATVRGTSYGHEKLLQNGEIVDKIITTEGSVEGQCFEKGTQRIRQYDGVLEEEKIIKKNQKGIFKCLKSNPQILRGKISNINEDDAEWILKNMLRDEYQESIFPEITFYDPGDPPERIPRNEPKVQIRTSTTEADLKTALSLEATVENHNLLFGLKPNILWYQVTTDPDSPTCNTSRTSTKKGPCVWFSNQVSAKTNAVFFKPGVYKLRATSYDYYRGFLVHDEIVVTVYGENHAPLVEAGKDQTVVLKKHWDKDKRQTKVVLKGTIADDGLPLLGELTYEWSLVEGDSKHVNLSPVDKNPLKLHSHFSKEGTYKLALTADDGEKVATDEVTINVLAPTNTAPSVDLGPDREISQTYNKKGKLRPAMLKPKPRVTDDRYPQKGINYQWSVVRAYPLNPSESNCVSIKKPKRMNPGNIQFTCQGEFTLRLIADDSDKQGFDEITVTVLSADEEAQTLEPLAEIFLPEEEEADKATLNIQDIFDYHFIEYQLSYSCANAQIDGSQKEVCENGTHIYRSNNGDGPMRISENGIVDMVAFKSCFAEGDCLKHTEVQDMKLVVNLYRVRPDKASDKDIATLEITETKINHPPMVDPGEYDTVIHGEGLQLSGSVSDEDIPRNSKLTTEWSVVASEGDVTFSDASKVNTDVIFSSPGSYTLRLAASDGFLTLHNDVTINVEVPVVNQPPTVQVGADQTVPLVVTEGDSSPVVSAFVSGKAINDGLPSNELIYIWTKEDGPGEVIITDPTSPDTTVSFDDIGEYTVRLTVFDGELSGTQTMKVTVVENKAPVAEAGESVTIYADEVYELNGTATDEGYLKNDGLSINWEQMSPLTPAAIIESPETLQTKVDFSSIEAMETITYVFRLTVSDGYVNATDTVEVTVKVREEGGDEGNEQVVIREIDATTPVKRIIPPDSEECVHSAEILGYWLCLLPNYYSTTITLEGEHLTDIAQVIVYSNNDPDLKTQGSIIKQTDDQVKVAIEDVFGPFLDEPERPYDVRIIMNNGTEEVREEVFTIKRDF
ncbi:MAG: PKD domain-containing protein [Patescibacteria group bacterium]